MAWDRPELSQITSRVIANIESRLTGLTALFKSAVLRILAFVFGDAIYILYGYVNNIIDELMVDTARLFVWRHGYIWGVPQKNAEFSSGNVIFTGVNTTSIPNSTPLQRGDGVLYTTTSAGIIANGFCLIPVVCDTEGETGNIDDGQELSLTSLITDIDDTVHTAQYELNYDNLSGGSFSIGDTVSNSTRIGEGLIISTASLQLIIIVFDGSFEDNDSFDNGSGVSADVNGNVLNINIISGGVDAESVEEWGSRIVDRIQDPPAGGSKDDIERWSSEVDGIEKGWCFPVTPSPGWITVLAKASGSTIIPSSTLLTTLYNYLMARVCVTCSVVTVAIIPVEIDFDIDVDPNTSDLQDKLDINMGIFFDKINYGNSTSMTIKISDIRDIIKKSGFTDYIINGIDVGGSPVSIANIVLSSYQYPTFGSITYHTL